MGRAGELASRRQRIGLIPNSRRRRSVCKHQDDKVSGKNRGGGGGGGCGGGVQPTQTFNVYGLISGGRTAKDAMRPNRLSFSNNRGARLAPHPPRHLYLLSAAPLQLHTPPLPSPLSSLPSHHLSTCRIYPSIHLVHSRLFHPPPKKKNKNNNLVNFRKQLRS